MRKLRRFALALFAIAFTFATLPNYACTSFLVTKGASTDGSTMITYAADAHTLYGELYYNKAATYPEGTMMQIVDWDSGKKLTKIPQVAQTYTTVGNSNEWGLFITETTYGGRRELHDPNGGMDYGSLIYITLQRAKTAREAIKTITDFVDAHGYYSSGESFSICDGEEVWILELIGKGTKAVSKDWKRGAVWVAVRVPDGYISGHANHARITQFPLEQRRSYKSISSKNLQHINRPEVEVIYSHDVISFARASGYFDGKDEDFSFSDTYAPIDFDAARYCEARVYSGFLKVDPSMVKYEKYAMGHDLTNRMPLWIKPNKKLSVQDVMELMRDHFQNTPMDMSKDIGGGPFNCPYRWRPMEFEYEGQRYIHERAISTQQTGFSLVGQSRGWMPEGAKGILWFGVDDTYSTVYVPIFSSITQTPECFRVGNGNMVTYSETAAYWLFNQVSNMAYGRYSDMIKDIRAKQFELESRFVKEVAALDKKMVDLAKTNQHQMRDELTRFSLRKSQETFQTWKTLSQYLQVKYVDGNIKKEKDGKFLESELREGENAFPHQPDYRKEWLRIIVEDHGDIIKDPTKK